MDPLEVITSAQSAKLVGDRVRGGRFELAPGLEPAEIERLEAEIGVPLPRELRALLRRTSGIDGGPLETIDFTGRSLSLELAEISPWALPIAHDGFGNFWVLDLTPDEAETAPVFFAGHDPPVILYQSPDIGNFLHESFRKLVPPHASAIDDVHEDRLHHVWRENPGALERSAALESDESLRAFATELDDRFTFVDLRSPAVGMGFSWGRYGPQTEVRRYKHERLFAYAPPEKKPGMLSRIRTRR